MTDASPVLPPHIEEAVGAISRLHSQHERNATRIQKLVDQLTAAFGRPRFVGLLSLAVVLWIAANMGVRAAGWRAIDPPPFSWLQGAMTLLAVFMTALILTTQRRADQLAAYREQLTLQLAILGDQKTAKVIELLEEMRRDSPHIFNRIDDTAAAMTTPADPEAVLNAIKDRHEEALAEEAPTSA